MAMVAMPNLETLVDSTALLENPSRIREQAIQDGYLFLPGLLEPAAVWEVRRQLLEVCQKHKWLHPDAPILEGIARPGESVCESDDPRWRAFYDDALKVRAFHALSVDPILIGALEVLFDEEALPHSRNICRVILPHIERYTTPPHQDHYYIGGTQKTWTAWIPCGDCPEILGGLAVARGSHAWGLLETHHGEGAGRRQVAVTPEVEWVGGEMLCGDVLLLNSHTIHQGRDNKSPDRLRLSCDFRYQPLSQPIRADSLQPHMNWLTWEKIYNDWPSDDPLKYYWEKWDLSVTESGN